MLIYIPTKGRTHKPQLTYETLPQHWQKKTWFVCPTEEVSHWSRLYDTNRVLAVDCLGVPEARQAICDHGEDRYVFQFDDDLRFCRRVPGWTFEDPAMCKSVESDIDEALHLMEDKLSNKYVQVGFGYRGNNNALKDLEGRKAARMMRSFGVDTQYMKKLGIRFDKYLFWEDFHVTLCFLKAGYPNWMSVVHCTDGVTNSEGGVSLYRTPERLMEVRARFLEEHAPFAKANNNKSCAGWAKTNLTFMPDLVIHWKKAYEFGKQEYRKAQQ